MAAVSSSTAIIVSTAPSSRYAASAAPSCGGGRSLAPNVAISSAYGGGRRTHDGLLASLRRDVKVGLMDSLGVADNRRVIAYMNHVSSMFYGYTSYPASKCMQLSNCCLISHNPPFAMPSFYTFSQINDHHIINAALQYVCEERQERGVENIPPYLMTKLKLYETNGPPRIPAGVNRNLIPSGLVGNIRFIEFLSRKAVNPNIINAALFGLNKQQNPLGLVIARTERYQMIEKQPLPDGVDEALIPTELRDDLILREHLIEVSLFLSELV